MRLVKILFLVLSFALAIIGQTNKGGITGTVSDQKGAAIPGATVTITNVATNTSVTVTTSSEGSFTVSNVEPVLYDIKIESASFKKALVQKVKVDTASVATVNVVLEVGNVSQEVTIQADAQMVNTDSGTISQTITERQLRDLPLNNRSVLDLAVTMPNVSGDSGSEDIDSGVITPSPGFNLSVNGGRPGSTSMLADGVNNTGVGIARAVVSFSPETVQEFSIQSSAFSAEFGSTGGGVINITTKSGANRVFGTALWYHRDPKTNARSWNQGTAVRPANNLRSDQLSFTVGGPIYLPAVGEGGPFLYDGHNKSFFFFAMEPRWRNDFSQGSGLVPTAAERSGNFRDVIPTSSGWLPTAVAAQFGLSQTVGADAHIYQQFTLGAGNTLVPIVVPNVAGNQYCPFGWVQNINGVQQVSFNNGQPYCTTTQAAAQIANKAANPALDVVPSGFLDPSAAKLLTYLNPAGSYFLDNGSVRNLFTLRQATQKDTRYTVRIDHNVTSKMKATFRWTKTPAVGIRAGTGSDINGNNGIFSDASQYLATVNYIFSANMTNEARFSYTKGNFSEDFSPEFSILSGRNLSTEVGLKSLTAGGLPLIQLSTGDTGQPSYTAPDIGSGLSTNNFNQEKRYDASDTFYWTHGNMLWKIGGNVNRAQLQVIPYFAGSGGRWQFRRLQTNNSPAGNFTTNNSNGNQNGGNNLASFLIGVVNGVDTRPSLLTYNYQWNSGAFFVQNDWKVKPNFTLNIGLRYSLQFQRTEANNLQGVFRPDLAQTVTYTDNGLADATTQRGRIAITVGIVPNTAIPSYIPTTTQIVPFAFSGRGGRSKNIVGADLMGFEPRFGFAWSPHRKILGMDLEKMSVVLRGGFGVSHAPITGNNRSAIPDFGGFTNSGTIKPTVFGGNASTGTGIPSLPLRLSDNNATQGTISSLDTLLGTDSNGLVFLKANVIPGVAVDLSDPNYGKVPYSQSWNLAIQFAPFKNTTVEIAYVGNRGVHLFTPQININPRDVSAISTLIANNINVVGNTPDPLGRTPLLGGTTPNNVAIAGLFSTYAGYEPLSKYFNGNSSSIRHAGYIDFRRRVGRGLSFSANYTYAKSIDDSSDASPDVRVLTSGSVKGQVALGGTLSGDRALSAFDTRHAFASTFTYDLPFGKGRPFLKNAPWYVTAPLGGWSLSGVARIVSGNPYQPFLTDPNLLGGSFNRVVRPDIVPGVPIKNPLWTPTCKVGPGVGTNSFAVCEPYVNPAAFMRPAKGTLGNAPRTLSITEPFRKYFDMSIQKDFPMPWIGGEGKRKINFRVDALNLFNIPNFYFNSRGNTPFGYDSLPTEFNGNECITDLTIPTPVTTGALANCTAANLRSSPIAPLEYDAWAGLNNKPLSNTAAGAAILGQIRSMVDGVRLAPRAGQTSGALPANFFSVAVPQGFATTNPLLYDLTTLQGFKQWRLRNAYEANFGSLTSGQVGNSFGSPNPGTSQRYLQFGIRLIF